MSELIGRTLGHYRVVEKIGEGGMGEVYLARDERLDRDVAIKVLPETVARNEERMARFEREARLLASLNHQNIATLHGLDEDGGRRLLVMELVDGEVLAERLRRGPLPIEDAMHVARQIAEGLEAAHEQGIVHRDLKPANVMLSPDGRAKILDFGLAKACRHEVPGADLSQSPTVTVGMTTDGVILGTAAYMSPEQAAGRPVDKRADIWAFGCVLYEMLTGRRPFAGDNLSETLASVIKDEPSLDALPADTSAAIRRLLSRCLRKDPRRRLRDIGEARVAIEDLGSGEPRHDETDDATSPRPKVLPWAIAAVAVLAAVTSLWVGARRSPTAEATPMRLSVSLAEDQRLVIGSWATVAISPDGSRIAYAASSPPGSRPRLWIRPIGRFEAFPIPDSEGAVGPFFSPDGEWLGYFAPGRLMKIFVDGGTPEEICPVVQMLPGAAWAPDDTIIFTERPNTGLVRVSASGGTPETLTTLDLAGGERGHGWPQQLPGGQHVLFTSYGLNGIHISLLSMSTGDVRQLTRGLGGARFLPPGHLVFARNEGLAAVSFDPETLEVLGSPMVVLEEIYTIPSVMGFGLAAYSVSDDGTLVYLPGGTKAGENRLVWVERAGLATPVTSKEGAYEWPVLSPDGSKIAVANRTTDGISSVWVLDIERGARSRLTADSFSILPVWTPDGRRIAFSIPTPETGVANIYQKAADGSDQERRLIESEHPRFARSFSPDGSRLALVEWNPHTMRDIWLLTVGADREADPLISTRADEFSPYFSPDGGWLAYVSDESGRYEVYVQSHPPGRGRWLVSTDGGTEPVWSADGTELFYRNADAMMVVPVRTDGEFSAGAPSTLFEKPLKRGIYDSLSYDVTPDGERFLMIERDLDAAPDEIRVVLDWREELQGTVPVDAK